MTKSNGVISDMDFFPSKRTTNNKPINPNTSFIVIEKIIFSPPNYLLIKLYMLSHEHAWNIQGRNVSFY